MKLTFTLFISFIYISVQAQSWQWAIAAAGGSNTDRNIVMAKDNSGNIYIAGEFESTCTFGSYTLTSTTGYKSVFVSKYDGTGNCLWAVKGGGTFSDNYGVGIATDNNGNVYVAGTFSNEIVFGGFTLSQSGYNSFIAKFDQSGNCQFLNPVASKLACVIGSLTVDNNGDFLITGGFLDSTYFGTFTVTSINNSAADIFIAKFNSLGNFIWVTTAGGPSEDSGLGINTNLNGDIFITGQFKQTATFGTNTVTSFGDFDIFNAKYDQNGNNIWVKNAGGSGADQSYSVSSDGNGNSYITGYYYPTPSGMNQLPAHFGTFLLPDNGAGNMFITKFDSAGTITWAKYGGGSQHDEGLAITSDVNGNSYVSGFFYSATPTTGAASFSGQYLYSTGVADAFIVKYNTYGLGLFSQKIGGLGLDKGKAVIAYPNGDVIFAGNYTSNVIINTTPADTLTTAVQQWRVFVAKYAGGSVGINDETEDISQINLFPNPASENITVSLYNNEEGEYQFEIIDAIGRVIAVYYNVSQPGLNDFIFNTNQLSTGAYLLKTTTNKSVINKRFSISR